MDREKCIHVCLLFRVVRKEICVSLRNAFAGRKEVGGGLVPVRRACALGAGDHKGRPHGPIPDLTGWRM